MPLFIEPISGEVFHHPELLYHMQGMQPSRRELTAAFDAILSELSPQAQSELAEQLDTLARYCRIPVGE